MTISDKFTLQGVFSAYKVYDRKMLKAKQMHLKPSASVKADDKPQRLTLWQAEVILILGPLEHRSFVTGVIIIQLLRAAPISLH